MLETIFDTLNAKAAAYAVESVFEKLGMSSHYGVWHDYRCLGRTLSGQTAEAFYYSMRHQSILIQLKLCSWTRLAAPIRR